MAKREEGDLPLTEKEQVLLDEIMDDFDFKEVGERMKEMDWRWKGLGRGGNAGEIPEVRDMRRKARALLTDVIKGGALSCETGGFVAERTNCEIRLSFIVEKCSVEIPEELMTPAEWQSLAGPL